MSSHLRDAAIFAGAGLLGVATGLPVRDFADAAKELFEHRSRSLAALIRGIEHDLRDYFQQEFGVDAIDEPISGTVLALLANSRVTLRQAVQLELPRLRNAQDQPNGSLGENVCEAILADNSKELVGLAEGETALVKLIITRIYANYLSDPNTLETLLPDALIGVIAIESSVERLPQAVANCMLELRAELLLVNPHRFVGASGQDSWLLRPEYAVVPFHPARQPHLQALYEWCVGPQPRALRLIHERGGMGKTRLALELIDRLSAEKWRCGFLDRSAQAAPEEAFERLCHSAGNVAIVVDYAETRRDELARLLGRAHRSRASRLRIVLLARARSEWWDSLLATSRETQEFLGRSADAVKLEPLPNLPDARASLFHTSVANFRDYLKIETPPAAAPDLSAPEFELPLFVQLAALSVARGRTLQTGDELLDDVITRERRVWHQALEARGLNGELYSPLLAQCVVLATLSGGCRDRSDLRRLIDRAPLARGTSQVTLHAIEQIVAMLYPDANGAGALRPDLLGEHLIEMELTKDADLWAVALADD
jgi:hypothetical protein